MKTKILLATGAALVALGTFGASHQAEAITTNGTVEAVIVQALSLTQNVGLDFGNISAGALGSTVVITTAGVRSVGSGDAALVGGGSPGAGDFTLDGEDGLTVDLDLPDLGVTLTSGVDNMTADTFTWDYNGGGVSGTGDGTFPLAIGAGHTLLIGGTLNVGAGQAAGSYTGTLPVTVNYQ